ncbi:hypothetical protein N9P20_00945 [Polaribacter sp.]|nr:hypothetical protein [Polaribacter sp.]
MSKIIKTFEDKSYSLSTGFTKDLGLFKVEATVWSNVMDREKVYEHEISDIEIAYYINDKYCRYQGFKELYEKLYGVDSFKKFEQDITYEFKEAYHDQTTLK